MRASAPHRALFAIGGVLLLAACYALRPLPRQGWDEGRFGPLVPHRTFPTDCSLCHVAQRWDLLKPDFAFDHAAATGTALEGAHANASCLRCHNDRGLVSEFVVHGCGGCHVDPHEGTLGGDCTACHDQQTFEPTGRIAEHARTRFPLAGAHLAAACDRCHEQARIGRYVGAPLECAACHQADLASATSPDHVALGYQDDCQRCHSPTAWRGAHFAHTTFALQGQHRAADCTNCHVAGGFAGTPRDCYSCHAADYAATTAPDHATAGFGTSCEQCHTANTWGDGNFDHDSFPISGAHDGLDCADCHTTGNYPTFSCIDCHEHRQSEADKEHKDEQGYSWNSLACFSCHPDGRE
ncbi:MAG: hypothetical protein EXS13_08245 [Planctomycetes bacterium]|nr:hypothetical protein [Planctomycetota bacterium]